MKNEEKQILIDKILFYTDDEEIYKATKKLINKYFLIRVPNIMIADLIILTKKPNKPISPPYMIVDKDENTILVFSKNEDENNVYQFHYTDYNFESTTFWMVSQIYSSKLSDITYLLESNRKKFLRWIQSLIIISEVEDKTTAMSHSQRVKFYAQKFAQYLNKNEDEIELIGDLAMLHDIGKLGLEQLLLYSPTRLAEHFENTYEDHPVVGGIFLSSIPELWYAAATVRHHHENWDGTGFPDKLSGENIPYYARFIGIIDWFDLATHTAASEYEGIMTPEEALDRMEKELGKMFDPNLGAAFIEFMRDFLKENDFI